MVIFKIELEHVVSQHVVPQHVATFNLTVPSSVYKLYWGEVDHCSKMDSYCVGNLLWLVFRDELECIFCSSHCANDQEKLIHIYNNHNKIWNIGISKFSSILKKLWSACFIHSDNVYTCVHCETKFYIEDLRILHKHMKSTHPIVILGYSILYNGLY